MMYKLSKFKRQSQRLWRQEAVPTVTNQTIHIARYRLPCSFTSLGLLSPAGWCASDRLRCRSTQRHQHTLAGNAAG
jgi:hypothetical protein